MAIDDTALIRGSCLAEFPAVVTELGADPAALLRTARINSAHAGRHDVFLSLRQVMQVTESAATATGAADFGLRLASRQGIEILGPVGVAARSAGSVGGALATFQSYLAAYSPGIGANLVQLDERLSLFQVRWLMDRLPRHAQATELALGVALRIFRFLLGPDYCPVIVHIPHEPLSPRHDYTTYFSTSVRFAEPTAAFTIRSADLARPLDQDPAIHEALIGYLDTVVADRASGATGPVRDLVTQLLPTGAATIDLVADQLGQHRRTLQRRLAAEGTTFAEVIDAVRRDLAERYLRDTDLTLNHLARVLGYTEQSTLTRSCGRWFGTGPAAHRTALRG